jgi:hypothetical protein
MSDEKPMVRPWWRDAMPSERTQRERQRAMRFGAVNGRRAERLATMARARWIVEHDYDWDRHAR